MEIIANRDYQQAKQFIEEHIDKYYITEEIKNQFVECYKMLTPENAKEIYGKVFSLRGDVLRTLNKEFNDDMFWWSGNVIMIGAAASALSYGMNYFIPNKHVKTIQNISIGITIFGFCMLFSIGH